MKKSDKIQKEPAASTLAPAAAKKSEDVAVVYGTSDDGAGLRVVRLRSDKVELGEVRPLEHGKPLRGEVVKLEQRGDAPVFDVKVQLPALGPAMPSLSGPAQVATDTYRENWDTIWSRPARDKKKLLN